MAKHAYDRAKARHLTADTVPDGIERLERTCTLCGVTAITLMPKGEDAFREFRMADGSPWRGAGDPPCVARQAAELKEAES